MHPQLDNVFKDPKGAAQQSQTLTELLGHHYRNAIVGYIAPDHYEMYQTLPADALRPFPLAEGRMELDAESVATLVQDLRDHIMVYGLNTYDNPLILEARERIPPGWKALPDKDEHHYKHRFPINPPVAKDGPLQQLIRRGYIMRTPSPPSIRWSEIVRTLNGASVDFTVLNGDKRAIMMLDDWRAYSPFVTSMTKVVNLLSDDDRSKPILWDEVRGVSSVLKAQRYWPMLLLNFGECACAIPDHIRLTTYFCSPYRT